MYHRREFLQTADQLLCKSGVLALLIVKCCRFRDINNAYGFGTGDDYLEQVEQRLLKAVRPVDVVGRIGDNEFGLLLPCLINASHAVLAANRIIAEFQRPIECGENQIEPVIVIGIATAAGNGCTHEVLLQQAGAALLQAQETSRDYASHVDQQDEDLPPDFVIEQEMHRAFEQDEYRLYFQPKIDLASQSVIGAEALMRWFSPKYGTVDTQHLVNILERSRLLMPLTKWSLNTALRQCAELQKRVGDFTVAVNLSPALLTDSDIADIAIGAVKIWGLQPSSLLLEVTEGAMMVDPGLSKSILQKISHYGISVSIDDFGTGYSSLSYLKDLPVNELKIDRSFVMNMQQNGKDASIVKASIDLGHTLGLRVVAEGVENEHALQSLTAMGCDEAQGYYMAMPMPNEDLACWITGSRWGCAARGRR